MQSYIINFIEFIQKHLTGIVLDTAILVCNIAIFAWFLVLIIKGRLSQKQIKIFAIGCFNICIVEFLVAILSSQVDVIQSLVITLISVILSESFCFLLFARKKAVKENKDARDFVKFIDSEIHRQNVEEKVEENKESTIRKEPEKEIDVFPIKPAKISTKNTKKGEDVCFSHARCIIERLYTYELKIEDKIKIDVISRNLNELEGEENTAVVLERINDNLDNLLKIMAKYS